jgi:uncharacterized protein
MIRLIYYAILAYVIYLVYRFLTSFVRKASSPRPKARLSGMMVKDEACNMYIPKEEAIKEVIEGREYFFHSKDCRKKFLDEIKSAGKT